MIYLRQTELGFDGVVKFALPKQFAGLGVLAVQVATLNHKVLDDTMKQQRVVELHTGQLHKVIAMLGRLVEQGYSYITFGSLELYLCPILSHNTAANQQHKADENVLFVHICLDIVLESLIVFWTWSQTAVDDAHQLEIATETHLLIAGTEDGLMEHVLYALLG